MQPTSDHDLLIELNVTTKEILRRLDGQDARLSRVEADYNAKIATLETKLLAQYEASEKRINALENFKTYILGGAAALGALAGLLSAWLKTLVFK